MTGIVCGIRNRRSYGRVSGNHPLPAPSPNGTTWCYIQCQLVVPQRETEANTGQTEIVGGQPAGYGGCCAPRAAYVWDRQLC